MLDGLTKPFKELPPKHFYDTRGSELFDQICELPEYYPTRTERAILETHARRHRRGGGQTEELLELGSGYADEDPRAPRRDVRRRARCAATCPSTSPSGRAPDRRAT